MKKSLVDRFEQSIKHADGLTLRKRLLIYQGLAMSSASVVGGILLLLFNHYLPAAVAFSYFAVSVLNAVLLRNGGGFNLYRNVQTSITLLVPFVLQWTLGGFILSGSMMVWAVLALTASVSYHRFIASLLWFVLFLVFAGVSLIFNNYFAENFNPGFSEITSLSLLVINILLMSSIVFSLSLYFARTNGANMLRLKNTYTKLVDSEKLAALGQISAGVAHEVNTPLGAIKSSAEESIEAFKDILEAFRWLSSDLEDAVKDKYLKFLVSCKPDFQLLSTREERQMQKVVRNRLEELGVSNSRFLADRLVQVGLFEVTPEMEELTHLPEFDKLIMLTYNLLNQQKNNLTVKLAVDKATPVVMALKTYMNASGSKQLEPTNIEASIASVLAIYSNRLKQGVTVVKNYEKVPPVMAFPDQMSQVWTNLIVNAVQAMKDKGTLTIGIAKESEHVLVSIQDTGEGIPKEIQPKIFEPFFTTKVSGEGSGLGLDIIKRIVEEHSSDIWFESVEGVGTTFYVRIPFKKEYDS